MVNIRSIIAVNEPEFRADIERLLEKQPEFKVIESCGSGNHALETINKENPDLVFLDVQLNEIDGFELLDKVQVDPLPEIIFLAAHDNFALQAFEVHAIDYLLKPIQEERMSKALEKSKRSIITRIADAMELTVEDLLVAIQQNRANPEKIMVKEDSKIFFLDTSDINWIESSGNYIKIITPERDYMIRETMKNIEEKLNSNIFFRIHRSTIVNISKVKVIEPWFHGDYQVTMDNGELLTMSRNYKRLLDSFSV